MNEELRKAERQIDRAYLQNPLVQRPFAEAAWRFLAANEERVMREIVRTARTGKSLHHHQYAALFDSIVANTKWPMRWLLHGCPAGGRAPSAFDDASYTAAMNLSGLGQSYSHFEAAFTYASFGALTLKVERQRILASDEWRRDTRFDAYDRLRQPSSSDATLEDVDSLIELLGDSVRVRDQWFYYDTGPRLMSRALEVLEPLIAERFRLPDDWGFSAFSLVDFRAVVRVVFSLAYLHFNARVIAARRGCVGLGYSRALYTTTRRELADRIRSHTGVDRSASAAIIDVLTFGARDQRNPDPALQPLIPMTTNQLAFGPNLILNSSMERNFAVLLNRLPDDKSLYSKLSKGREVLSRDRVIKFLDEFGYRHWSGRIKEWGAAAEIDLVIISDNEHYALALEMKSFVAPADPREVHERSAEIKRGIEQVAERRARMRELPKPFQDTLGIDMSYDVVWAVASETSIGAPYVQSESTPVIQTRHLIEKLRRERRLTSVGQWLQSRGYLPIERVHFETVDFVATVGEWSLPWYGIKGLVADFG